MYFSRLVKNINKCTSLKHYKGLLKDNDFKCTLKKLYFFKSVLKCVKNYSHESVLSLSALKWPFISLILHYLQVQFSKYIF